MNKRYACFRYADAAAADYLFAAAIDATPHTPLPPTLPRYAF